MKNKVYVISIILILIMGLFFSLHLVNKQNPIKPDIVEINNIEKYVEAQWGNTKFVMPNTKLKFKVIDLCGNIKYNNFISDNLSYDAQIFNSIKNGDIIIDVKKNNQIVGKLIIINNFKAFDLMKKNLRIIVSIVYVFLACLCIIYLIYLNVYIKKPFKRLSNFAGRIAEGNLDIPLEMDKHNVFGSFTESFDIMREQLKISRHNEYLANRSKKELIASLSHDIKTPIASIKAICEIMDLKLSKKEEVNKIHSIYQKADQIEKLVNDMFQSTLDELQELKVEPDIYPSSIINEIINNNNFYEKIEMVNSCPECLIYIDRLRIEQVIDNIINNSYKYADTIIQISYSLDETHLTVFFKDYGKGVNEEELPLIFNKFYRGSNSKEVIGSGLGLFLSSYFMEYMQGDIECYNVSNGFVAKINIKLA